MKTVINNNVSLTIFVAAYFIGLIALIYTVAGKFGLWAILPAIVTTGFLSWAMVRK